MSPGDMDPSPVTNLGCPTRLTALRRVLDRRSLHLEALGLGGLKPLRAPLPRDCSWSGRWAAAVRKSPLAVGQAALPEGTGPASRRGWR